MSTQDPASPQDGGRRRDATTSLPSVGAPDQTSELASRAEEAEPGTSLSTDEQVAVAELPPGTALLVVQRGPNSGARFLLDAGRTTAGRNPDSDIFLDDVTVSRRHAEFVRTETGFQVRDVGSLNGTYVNRDRVDEVVLSAGDEVQIGKYRLTYHPYTRTGGASGS